MPPSRFAQVALDAFLSHTHFLRDVKSSTRKRTSEKLYLGIDGGGTRTIALLANERGQAVHRLETGPANFKLLTDQQLITHLRFIGHAMPSPSAISIGLAGAWTNSDTRRVRNAAQKVWPNVPCHATNDLETALAAASNSSTGPVRILIVAGTGSCVFAKDGTDQGLKIGGWGHVLGDQGSAYQIGLFALRSAVNAYDKDGKWPPLGERLLRSLLLNEPGELISWAQSATKSDIASLAVEVFAAAKRGDKLAKGVLACSMEELVRKALLCAQRLAKPKDLIEFVLAGGVLLKQPAFAAELARQLQKNRPRAIVTPLRRESVWGAVELARRLKTNVIAVDVSEGPILPLVRSGKMSPTEQRNPRSMQLDNLSSSDAVKLMITEDARVHRAVLAERKAVERTLKLIVDSFKRGGRLFYVGAGTSGRLGVLDASECPVTFRTPPEMVQGIIAGGQIALWKPVEGAEDDNAAGARAILYRGVSRRDVVIGIAASGTTRFVWGALVEARARGAKTVLLAFNPHVEIPPAIKPDVCILPNLGPEVLTGSTRLKAGTATKLVLNTLTTLAMVKLGKISSNLMVDVIPTNVKLRDRAARIVRELTGATYDEAWAALQATGWVIKMAASRLSRRSRARQA